MTDAAPEPLVPTPEAPAAPTPQVVLAGFQQAAVDAIRDTVVTAAAYQRQTPTHRREVAQRIGATLLQAPTGSGKTLMLGRALEAIRGRSGGPCVWFWFAPFTGLVAQTRTALSEQCPSLRLRDVARDRSALMTRDGDVFVQTWALVAANRKDARIVRTRREDAPALDDMLEDLRDRGVRVGVVIDEAHLNFGSSAKAAADFYLEVLRPDFTLLATATPNDDRLEEFERRAGVTVENRVVVSRAQAVEAGLNKHGLTLGVVRLEGRDAELIDRETAALTVAWRRHNAVKDRLAERGLGVVPLMLVQVEDEADGGPDPVEDARRRLIEIGVPPGVIAVHTSKEPDADFHTLAYDPSREVLIFKVAVATGFDAPRAWTLASLRRTRGVNFGLQIVGRIMRVHPLVRPIHGQDPLLDRGYVFLTDPELQAGLDAAAEELKAVRASIETVADDLMVLEFTNADRAALDARRAVLPHAPPTPRTDEERLARLDDLIGGGFVDASLREAPPEAQTSAVMAGEWSRELGATPLFGDLPEQAYQVADPGSIPRTARTFPVLQERGVPVALLRERPPAPEQMDGSVIEAVARELFRRDRSPLEYLSRTLGRAGVSLRDLFLADRLGEETFNVRMSEARIAEQAQASFEFNETVSARNWKRALVAEFRRTADNRGMEYADETTLRRALDLFALHNPDALPDALKVAQAQAVVLEPADPIPPLVVPDGAELRPARQGAYAIFPPNMNANERSFAELIDADDSGKVLWWLRLQENARWATTLVLPSGRRFFPDFAIGVKGRSTRDQIALVETKDDGVDGRLH
ncbi:MAG: DEAD/DEAH box helicase, partial [Brevundimonas sp.]